MRDRRVENPVSSQCKLAWSGPDVCWGIVENRIGPIASGLSRRRQRVYLASVLDAARARYAVNHASVVDHYVCARILSIVLDVGVAKGMDDGLGPRAAWKCRGDQGEQRSTTILPAVCSSGIEYPSAADGYTAAGAVKGASIG